MDILLRIAGMVSGMGYALGRYRALGFPLDTLSMIGSLAVVPWVIWDGWARGYTVTHVLVAALCLLLFILLLVLRLRRYVVFCDEPVSVPEGVRELGPDERVRMKVTGFLEVHGERRHFVEAPALFRTTELQEHIIMARLRTRASVGPIRSVANEWGWWYAFVSPKKVQRIDGTSVYHGLARRRAIRVVYTSEDGKDSSLFLSFDRPEDLALIAQDLGSRSDVRDEAIATPDSLSREAGEGR